MQREKESKRKERKENELWDNFKRFNMHVIGVPEMVQRDRKIYILEELTKFFPI